MTKATLTGRQVGAAVLAGIFGHLLFAAGWIILALSLLGGTILAILGGTVKDAGDAAQIFGAANGIVLGLVIAAVVLVVIGFVVSGLILRGGTVRKPWGTSLTAIIIAAIIDIPVIAAYLAIARATEGSFILIALGVERGLAARLRELYYIDSVGIPYHYGSRYFYSRRHADREKGIVYWKEGKNGAAGVSSAHAAVAAFAGAAALSAVALL
mgnify:CR=1 FL=1